MHSFLTWPAAALLACPVAAQGVAFEQYRLDNGLEVILHEDHALPIATINIWYHVGSKDEVAGRSGFAHLFEHLMFMGTKRVPGAAFDELMEAGGGRNNASTTRDRTNFFSIGPSNLLPTLLWLDADRMADFGRAMTQEKLDKQREVVRNERRQTVEMRPYGKAEEGLGRLLYPPSHPYRTSVIGSHHDLEAASLEDVKDFFATYYVPNNASLVVAGDFDPKEVKPLIARWFGAVPRGSVVPRRKVEPVAIDGVRRVETTDRVQFARLSYVWLSPAFFRPGDAEMDIAASVLTSGKSSRLYKRLVYDDKLATSVTAYQWSSLYTGQFHVQVLARPGVALGRIEKAVDEELRRFVRDGPTADELERTKARLEYGAVTKLESLAARADALNRYEFYLGTPDGFAFDLERYRKVTAASTKQWAAKVLDMEARVIEHVLPQGGQVRNPLDERPAAGASKPFQPPLPARFRLSNGIEVRHWHRPELPLVRVELYLRGGSVRDPAGKAGTTSLLADMVDEGAGDRSALEFSDAVARLGASLGAHAERHNVQVTLQSLETRFAEGLDLLADAVLRPRFEPKEWDRVKTLHLRALQQLQDDPSRLARVLTTRAFFGPNHPYGRPVDGTLESVPGLGLADIRAAWRRTFQPQNALFLVAGDLTRDEAKARLEKAFGSWKDEVAATAAPEIAAAPQAGRRVFLVDRPDAVQTVIRFMMPGPSARDPNRVTLQAINTVLGGSFTSRLNQDLREKHGYTYGAFSGLAMWPTTGVLVATASVQAKHTGAALREFLAVLRGMGAGNVTEAEARKAKATSRRELVQVMEGLSGLLAVATRLEDAGLEFSTLTDQLGRLDALDAAKMNALAHDAVPLDDAALMLVGNKKHILDEIRGLGLPRPVELDVHGKPVPGR